MQLVQPETVLETDRLSLEPLHERHAVLLHPALGDPRIYSYIPHAPPTLAALQERYRKLATRRSPAGDEAWLNWAVRIRASGVYLGRVEASVTAERTAEIAYEFAPLFWGQGYATEACQRVLAVLFIDYAVAQVGAQVDTRNQASIALLERLGFERIGLQRAADFFNGSSSDEYTYRLLPLAHMAGTH